MKTIPLVLTFDSNLSLPAAVCISSLMQSASEDTFYDIFVLYSGNVPEVTGLNKIKAKYSNMNITFRSIGNYFSDAFEIRGITKAAYYRLLSARFIPEYDKIIYADVDTIFRRDLTELYDYDLKDNILGAVYAFGMNTKRDGQDYIMSIGIEPGNYFVSGFLLMDLAKIRANSLTEKFIEMAKTDYKFQDQDIINIVCKGRIMPLPYVYHMGVSVFEAISLNLDSRNSELLFNPDGRDPLLYSNIHYNGVKPWNNLCPNFDQWWECYRNSPVYDPEFYFSFFNQKLNSLDQLSLLKRVKLLMRYFTHGKQ